MVHCLEALPRFVLNDLAGSFHRSVFSCLRADTNTLLDVGGNPLKDLPDHVGFSFLVGDQREPGDLISVLRGFHRIYVAGHLAPVDLKQVNLPVPVSGKLIEEHDTVRDIHGIQRVFAGKDAHQTVDHDLLRVLRLRKRLYAEHGDIVMGRLNIYRHDPAALDAVLPRKLCFDAARGIFLPLVIEEEAVGSPKEDDLSVRLHPHIIVGAVIGLPSDHLGLQDLLPVERACRQRRRGEVENAFRGEILLGKELLLLLVKQTDGHSRQRVADRLVVQIRRGKAAGAAKLGQPVAVQDGNILAPAVLNEEGMVSFLVPGRNGRAAKRHETKAGEIKGFLLRLRHLHPALKHGSNRKQEGNAVRRDGLVEGRVQDAGRNQDHARTHGKWKMHLVDHAVAVAELHDHGRHQIVKGKSKVFHLIEAGGSGIEGLVRERDRIAHAAGRSRGMQNDRGFTAFILRVGDREGLIGGQQLVHADRAEDPLQVAVLDLLAHGEHRM